MIGRGPPAKFRVVSSGRQVLPKFECVVTGSDRLTGVTGVGPVHAAVAVSDHNLSIEKTPNHIHTRNDPEIKKAVSVIDHEFEQ